MARSSNTRDGQSEANDTFALILVAFALIVGIILFWKFKHDTIVHSVSKFYYYVTYIPAWLAGSIGWTSWGPVKTIQQLAGYYAKPEGVTFGQLFAVSNKASMVFYPFLALFFYMRKQAIGHAILKVRTTHGFWSLMEVQSRRYHYIIPVLRFEKYWNKNPAQRKKWRRRAIMPDEWVEMHDLIDVDGGDFLLNIEKTQSLMEAQLKAAKRYRVGEKLKNPLSLMTDYEKALFVIFASRIVGPDPTVKQFSRSGKSREYARNLLGIINKSCKPCDTPQKSFDFATVAAKADPYVKNPIIRSMIQEHNYVHTLLMRLLFEARKDGKLPCSHFIWLKICDVPLWYALQGVTYRQINRNFVEAAAVCAQFWSEMTAIDNNQVLVGDSYEHAIPALEHTLLRSRVITKTSEMYNPADY